MLQESWPDASLLSLPTETLVSVPGIGVPLAEAMNVNSDGPINLEDLLSALDGMLAVTHGPVPTSSVSSWTSAGLNGTELAEYCRCKGLYVE